MWLYRHWIRLFSFVVHLAASLPLAIYSKDISRNAYTRTRFGSNSSGELIAGMTTSPSPSLACVWVGVSMHITFIYSQLSRLSADMCLKHVQQNVEPGACHIRINHIYRLFICLCGMFTKPTCEYTNNQITQPNGVCVWCVHCTVLSKTQ